jgi:hypothetical protein
MGHLPFLSLGFRVRDVFVCPLLLLRFVSLLPQRNNRVHLGSATRWQIACRKRNR